MADGDTVTIRAELIDDVTPGAHRIRESVRGLGEDVKASSGGAAGGVSALGKAIDDSSVKAKVMTGAHSEASRAMKDLTEQTGKVRESLGEMGSTVTEKVRYPLQQLTYTLEAAAAGMVAFGLATGNTMQQASLQIGSFTGSTALGGAVATQLRALSGPSSMTGLQGAYEQLFSAGMSNTQDMSTLTRLNNLAATRGGDPALSTLSSIFSAGTMSKLLTGSQIQQLAGLGLPAYQLAGQQDGLSVAAIRTAIARDPGAQFGASSILSGILNSQGSLTGKAQYSQTWAGQLSEVKKAFGNMLAVFETPLGNALDGAGKKVETWATGTEARFKLMGGNIGKDWSADNMGGLGHTLANIVGDPGAAAGIQTAATALHGLVGVIDNGLIPAAKDILTIASPALRVFGDTLDIIGKHRALAETLIGTLIGLEVASKVGKAFQEGSAGIRAFQTVLSNQGLDAAVVNMTKKLLGLKVAEEAVASGGTGGAGGLAKVLGGDAVEGAGADGGIAALLGGASGAALPLAAGVAVTAAGTALLAHLVNTGLSRANTAYSGDGIGPNGLNLQQLSGMNFRDLNLDITVPGTNDPTAVANSIPKAMDDHLKALQASHQRRGRTP
jgi:hypothetical protein